MKIETPKEAARRLSIKQISQGFVPQALHEYCDSEGKAIYWRIRLKHSTSGEKWIRPMHVNSDGVFVLGNPPFSGDKPLYRLPDIIQRPKELICFVEGEWCADHLSALGFVTTTTGGADSTKQIDWSVLANRTIIIWRDNDEAGLRYARAVTAKLAALSCVIRWVDVDALQLPEKGDCVDWLALNPHATQEIVEELALIEAPLLENENVHLTPDVPSDPNPNLNPKLNSDPHSDQDPDLNLDPVSDPNRDSHSDLNPHPVQKESQQPETKIRENKIRITQNKNTKNKNRENTNRENTNSDGNDENDCLVESTSSHRDKPAPQFITNERGVFYLDEKGMFRVCSKLEITALVRDKASENWGRLLEITDADGYVHSWAMPMEMLKGGGDELRGELLRLGLEISPGMRIRNLLIEYITLTKPETRARCVTRTGWYGDVFVLPNQTIGDTDEKVIYQSENPLRDYQSAGTLEAWQKNIALPSHGNSRLMLALSCAFASMLLHPAGAESGGVHFVGESSSGKTTALRVAASVFGAPDYLNRWRATTNGLEALASLRSDTLLILDELAQVDSKEAGEIAYMLANGSGKTRAARTGNARSRHEWRLLFLSAGEVGLSQHLRDAGKKIKAGQAVRLVDIPADAGKELGIFEILHNCESGAQLSQLLNEATTYYYGTPSIAFLNAITKPETLSRLPAIIKQYRDNFLDDNLPPNASGQVHRVCERFALIGAGGEIASMLGITGWSIHASLKAASTCFQTWLEHRGGAGNQERTAVLAHVQAFFEAHGASRFEDMHSVHAQQINNRVGFKRISNGEKEYFVLPEMFRQEMCNGFETHFVARVLMEAGMLNKSPEGKAQTAHRLPGEGLKKCYHFVKTEPQ
jgi:uncharacterized protein (DUF927 family)